MKRLGMIVMAGLLVLGLAQCKKEQTNNTQSEGNVVRITLNVGPSTGSGTNNGSRVNVDPDAMEQVTFANGDQIVVASNGAVVGTLTREEGVFGGEITNPTEGQPLYFYFLGNKQGTVANGTAELTVNISDQTTEAGLPVISMGPSTVNYSTAETNYTSSLHNKCSLMKFNVTTPSTAAICITGMNNTVTVDFSNPTDEGFTYGKDGDGLITMPGVTSENTTTWAIVLPQDALAEGEDGSVYTADDAYAGTRPQMDAIGMNTLLDAGVDLTAAFITAFTVDFNDGILPEGWTTIDADGDGYNWVLDTECESAYGYDQSNAGFNGSHMILSGSYHKTAGALHPDNYLVSPKVTLRSGSTFSFWAGSQDYQYPAEHFGVFVSDNGTSGWTMVQEWTMEAKGASGDKGFGRDGNTRDQGRWYYFSVDLSTYAGEKKYIAIRHFNCSDNFFLNVDNIRLGDPEPGTSFSQNFNNSVLPEGWTTIDADGDGYNWVLTNQMAAYGYSASNDGHYGTVGMTSGSYHGSVGPLTPDNYLVTPKVNLVQGSTFSFWACAQDADYPAEHFGVYVSDNGTSGWTMVQEWTMTAKGASGNKGNGRDGNTRDIGNWYQYTVDLSAYAGEKYIAIRHFNCSDEFFLEVDDILLTVNNR